MPCMCHAMMRRIDIKNANARFNLYLHLPERPMTDPLDNPGVDAVTEFGTYEEYLDSHITTEDLYYLEVCVSPNPAGARVG